MVVGNYQINEPFLKDVFGTFYKGYELKTNTPVIIHCVDDTLANDPDFLKAYTHYVDMAANLDISNFAKALSYGNQNEILFTIYPNKNYTPLKHVLSQNSMLSIFDAPNLLEKISLTVRTLHLEGNVHGALSPECIFVDTKLENFEIFNTGSANLVRCLLKKYPRNLHKILPFLSPEILDENKTIERQSDIYSLGILFYTALIGHTPWPDTEPENLLVAREAVIPPSLHRLEIPDFLDEIILEAVEPELKKRCGNLSLFLNNVAEAKSNILASFTPTSALIYGQIEEPAPPDAEENQTQEIKSDTTIGIIAIEDSEESQPPKDDLDEATVENEPESLEVAGTEEKVQSDIEVSKEDDLLILKSSGDSGESDDFIPENDSSEFKEEATGQILSDLEDVAETEEADHAVDEEQTSYKEQLLNHENDFFSRKPEPENEVDTDDFDDSKILTPVNAETQADPEVEGVASDLKNGIPKEDKPVNGIIGESVQPPELANVPASDIVEESAPAEAKENKSDLLTDASSEQAVKFKTYRTAFPVMQINEFDDRLSFKNYRESQAQQIQSKNPAPTTHLAAVPQAENTKSAPEKNNRLDAPPGAPEFHPDELDDFDEKTATATEEHIAEHYGRVQSKSRIFQNVLKKVGIPLISILAIYVLVLFMIDLGISDGIDDIKNNIQSSNNDSVTNVSRPKVPNPRGTRLKNGHQNNSNRPARQQKQNIEPLDKLANNINSSIQEMAGLNKNPLENLNQRRSTTITTRPSRTLTQQSRPVNSPTPARTEPEVVNDEAQLIVAVRSNAEPLVANVYLDGRLYGKTNNQGILSIPSLQKNQRYLLRIDKSGYDMFAREINLANAGIETVDANLTEIRTEITSTQLRNLKERRRTQQKNLAGNEKPKAKESEKEFGTVNILLNNVEPIADAVIHINGRPWQGNNYEAPAELQLPSGTYVIEIQKEGYISAPQSYTLDIINGDYKTVSFILTAF